MKSYSVLFSVLLVVSLFSRIVFAQEEQDAAKPKRKVPLLSFYVSGNYFAPAFNDLNAVYKKIEQVHALPAGGDFKNFYTVSAGIRFAPLSLHYLEVEASGSIWKAQPEVEGQHTSPTNYLQLSSLGASYVFSLPFPSFIVSCGGGGGYLWLHSQRSYPSKAIVRVRSNLVEFHGILGIEFFHSSGMSAGVRFGYSYATTMYPVNADVDLTLKGATVKVYTHIPLIRI